MRNCGYPFARYRRRRERSSAERYRSASISLTARCFEPLEPRLALAAQFVISEFMASNTAGIRDQDLHFSDWIEVQNIGDYRRQSAGLLSH